MSIRGRCLAAIVIAASALTIPPEQAWDNEKLTVRNKAIVRDFYRTVLIDRDVDTALKHFQRLRDRRRFRGETMEGMLQDIRCGARILKRNLGFTTVALT